MENVIFHAAHTVRFGLMAERVVVKQHALRNADGWTRFSKHGHGRALMTEAEGT